VARVILIAEDDPKSLKLTRDLLEANGYATIEATDGAQAIGLARVKEPDLILMDIMMPVMDGYTACRAIKTDTVTKEIPVLMLTALGYELNVKLAKEIGADGYITKPFTVQKLLDVIGQFLPTP